MISQILEILHFLQDVAERDLKEVTVAQLYHIGIKFHDLEQDF